MPTELIFEDDRGTGEKLEIAIKPDQIEWGYGLNTQVTPTYGGEVIQILSAYIENMTVTGQVRTYNKAEEIFNWFVKRIEGATQSGEFRRQEGVKMFYPERQWQFRVLPLSIGPLKYGRDIVVPEWSATFHVVQSDKDLEEIIVNRADQKLIEERLGTESGGIFGKATGNIGFDEFDAFRSPVGQVKKDGKWVDDPKERKRYDELYAAIIGDEGKPIRYSKEDIGDWFNNLIPSYLDADFSDLSADYSRPTLGSNRTDNTTPQQGAANAAANIEKYLEKRRGSND